MMNNKNIVLIVDDNVENLNVLSDILDSNGYIVHMAISGADALKSISVSIPDLVLLDINMPGMSGFEVCSKIKENIATTNIPILFLSALSEVTDMVKAFELGGLDYITKPYIPEIVLARVKTHIELYKMKQNLEKLVKDRTAELQTVNEELISTTEILKDNYAEIEEAKEKAEESERLKTAFLQNMSHEIRTPMNAITGFSSMLNKPGLTEEKRKSFISIINNSSAQLLSIVTDILTISSIDTNQEKVNITQVSINDIIVDLLSIFKPQANNQNISLYIKQQLVDKHSEIYTDSTKLTQIMTNLLTNSLKFTHEGFIEFGYTLRQAHGLIESVIEPEVTEHSQSIEIQFYVKDTGIGIKPELQEKIFERFRQADLSINKKYGGTGLGLSISKGFVEILGGKIWVESEPDKGATFYFTIPYNPVNKTDLEFSIHKQNETLATILIAEDEEFNFLLIEELLLDMNFKLIHTKDGRETIEFCKDNKEVDLILMDIKMPVMDGYNAALVIKTFRPNLPIIAQTAYALKNEIENFGGQAFDDYITKPIDGNELKEKVLKYISK